MASLRGMAETTGTASPGTGSALDAERAVFFVAGISTVGAGDVDEGGIGKPGEDIFYEGGESRGQGNGQKRQDKC